MSELELEVQEDAEEKKYLTQEEMDALKLFKQEIFIKKLMSEIQSLQKTIATLKSDMQISKLINDQSVIKERYDALNNELKDKYQIKSDDWGINQETGEIKDE